MSQFTSIGVIICTVFDNFIIYHTLHALQGFTIFQVLFNK